MFPAEPTTLFIPPAPALVAGPRGATGVWPDGAVDEQSLSDCKRRLANSQPPIVCHRATLARRLNIAPFPAFDVLELFAFVRPARFCLPTARGIAAASGLPPPGDHASEALALVQAAARLMNELAAPSIAPDPASRRSVSSLVWAMQQGGWPWAPWVLRALGISADAPHSGALVEGFKVWNRLPRWEELPPDPPPDNLVVEPVEARARLVRLKGESAENRPEQIAYAEIGAQAFAPRERAGEPHVVIAEAGTGVGKTLGYLAPATVWAEKNRGTVWISTYTRNLQRQLDAELDRAFPDMDAKRRAVVVRKGRENYLCLLNFEDAVARLGAGADPVALGLVARWAEASRDGDMVGGDFPAWLADLVGRDMTVDLTDTRGECVYSACTHYGRCFIERTVRRARRAQIVVANHALVMVQAALGGGDEAAGAFLPTRYVFDEGHHLFDAADQAFAAHLSGRECEELRRWVLGAETRRRARSRGLRARVEDLIGSDDGAKALLDDALAAAHALPGVGWAQRLGAGQPHGPAEAFLARVRQQVMARASDTQSPYGLETETRPPVDGLLDAAQVLELSLERLARPLRGLAQSLTDRLATEADTLETPDRLRIEAVARRLERCALVQIGAWRSMLQGLDGEMPADFVDWFSIERFDGRDLDVGYRRHWVDPMRPFSAVVAEPAHGLLITSASLRDGTGDPEADWQAAEARTGARHLPRPAVRAAISSPFDYAAQTRVFVVGDVRKDSADQVAAAFRSLFIAAGGGAVGLFTAVHRLRAVHSRIAGALDTAGLPLYAQHVDGMDTGTLVDIFRAEQDSCLLGTDAVRDGVDVPGRSLRLIVFDRVPWPRPDILHRARRQAFGVTRYDDMIARARLRQGFGRLVRRASDRGVFILLDAALPSRLLGAFPADVPVARVGLAEAVRETQAFLAETGSDIACVP